MTESVTITGGVAARADLVVGAGHDGPERADRGAAAQRPQLRQPDAHDPRRAPRHSRARTSTARAAWPGAPRPRSPPTASGRATTTSCSTASTTTRPGCRPSSSSRASTRSTSSSCRRAPTRPSSAARSAASSTCRSSRAPTSCAAAPSSSTATTRSTPTTSSTTAPAAPSRTSTRTSSAARSAAPIFKDKTFFFADYQGHRESRGRRASRRCRRWRCAAATSPSSTASIFDPTTGQPFPGNAIPDERIDPVAPQHPHPALSRAEHRRHAQRQRADRSTTT